jgi:hypothetical protein
MINRTTLLDAGTGHLTDGALVLMLDGELPADLHSVVEVHLARCEACQVRLERFERLDARLRQPLPDTSTAQVRARLESRLADMTHARHVPASSGFPRPRHWAYAAAACLAVLVAGQVLHRTAGVEAASLPVAALTPGAVDPITVDRLCAEGARQVGMVSRQVRLDVLTAYQMVSVSPSDYELDYLITPELGGANDPRNLWPQRYSSAVWNARVKDQLEVLLPRLVCAGQVDLASAQRDIAGNWIAAYRKYFGTEHPIPAAHGARPDDADDDDPVVEADMPMGFAGVQARAFFQP